MDDQLLAALLDLLGPHAATFLLFVPVNALLNAFVKATIAKRWPVETWSAWAQGVLIVSDFFALNTQPAARQIKEAKLRSTMPPPLPSQRPASPWHEDPNNGDGT